MFTPTLARFTTKPAIRIIAWSLHQIALQCHYHIGNSSFNFGSATFLAIQATPMTRKDDGWQRSDFAPSHTHTWHDTTRTLTVRFVFV